jgi:amino acid permease
MQFVNTQQLCMLCKKHLVFSINSKINERSLKKIPSFRNNSSFFILTNYIFILFSVFLFRFLKKKFR